ncbi:MAG: hypothetical protein WAV40_03180 [Microgenomates group bacterium]
MRGNWGKVIGIFLVVSGALTATINSWNAEYFGLQNATVAALVEKGTFALVDQVIPGFNLVEGTETFRYGKSVYPMKQPGGTIIGAIVYAPLYKVGFTYANHFDYVSHLITFGTSTMMIALSAVIIYYLALSITKKHNVAMISALLFPLGTIIWPYAGVSHHDIYGVFWGLLALACYYFAHKFDNQRYLFFAGLFSTLTLFFTMLPLTLPIVLWGMTIAAKDLKKIVNLTLGMIVGVLPTSIFNGLVFGNPFLPPNLAGKVSDTMPLISLPNLLSKLWFYLGSPTTSLIVFSPILIFGVIGIWNLRKNDKLLARLLFLIPATQLLHISSMETFGGYQYGPRYLLPTFGCLILGVSVWLKEKHTKLANYLFIVTAIFSVVIAKLGALQTVMYPVPGPYAPIVFFNNIIEWKMPIFRMLYLGIMIFGIGLVTLYVNRKDPK